MGLERVEALRKIYGEWARGNFRAGRELLDPAVVFKLTGGYPDERPYHGPDGVERYMRDFLEDWAEFRIEAREFIQAGDSLLVTARQYGRGRESGAETELQVYTAWTFEGDRVIRLEFFTDEATAMEAVGPPRSR